MIIEIKKDVYTYPRGNLEQLGYQYEGIEQDKRGKKHTLFSKDGTTYAFKGADITKDPIVITLEIY